MNQIQQSRIICLSKSLIIDNIRIKVVGNNHGTAISFDYAPWWAKDTCTETSCWGTQVKLQSTASLINHKGSQSKTIFSVIATFGGLFSLIKSILLTVMMVYTYFYVYICCCFGKEKIEKEENNDEKPVLGVAELEEVELEEEK
jgi:hypothetical protein